MNTYSLLKQLTEIPGLSGDESLVKDFILSYVEKNALSWKCRPEIYHGDGFQDTLILVFGRPRMAAFAHMDTVGFCTRYASQLISVGSPDAEDGTVVLGMDSLGPIKTGIKSDDSGRVFHQFDRGIEPGTFLSYEPFWEETEEFITSTYLDNRLGVFNLLKVAENLTDGVLVFSTYEEHGGGSVPFLIRFLHEKYGINKALISDITWVTSGVAHGAGAAISLRDKNIPRISFTKQLRQLASNAGLSFQLEVEAAGSSDGRELQLSPYPIDWCFVGAPIKGAHTPREKVCKSDIESMIALYTLFFRKL